MFFVRRHFFTVVGQSWHRIKSFRQFNHVSAILRSTYTVSILTPRQKFADNKTGPISTDGQICFIFLIPEEKNWLHVLSWRSVIHEWQLWELAPEYAPCTANNFLGGGEIFVGKSRPRRWAIERFMYFISLLAVWSTRAFLTLMQSSRLLGSSFIAAQWSLVYRNT